MMSLSLGALSKRRRAFSRMSFLRVSSPLLCSSCSSCSSFSSCPSPPSSDSSSSSSSSASSASSSSPSLSLSPSACFWPSEGSEGAAPAAEPPLNATLPVPSGAGRRTLAGWSALPWLPGSCNAAAPSPAGSRTWLSPRRRSKELWLASGAPACSSRTSRTASGKVLPSKFSPSFCVKPTSCSGTLMYIASESTVIVPMSEPGA
mmetsp:Transcript_20962/g.46168  ORF Transcript_20962/g.46168 Transcript_20962/m.46168 type:complete len:204 (-) Transcript_20962:589-1200(-)